jgi:hypothetical protein
VDQWRAERQDDNGPGEQPGPSLKDPLHVTSPLLQGQAMFRRRLRSIVEVPQVHGNPLGINGPDWHCSARNCYATHLNPTTTKGCNGPLTA